MKIKKHIVLFQIIQTKQLVWFCICLFSIFISAQAQTVKTEVKEIKEAQVLLSEASFALKNDNFPKAEADYRKSIALDPKEQTSKYNLGASYYDKELNASAMLRFKQAASVASKKEDKHKAFHNLGNTFMNEKKYQEAVDSYKNALRNNPTDDETRYNLALAKKLLEQQNDGDGEGDDKEKDEKQEDDKDSKDNKDKDDQKDKDEENKDKEDNKDQDKGDEKEDKDKGNEEDDKEKGDEEKDESKNKDPKDQKEEQKQQQPEPGKLSPQQIKNLLQAMNNEEKKVQDKMNAKKQKGAKVKSEKDW